MKKIIFIICCLFIITTNHAQNYSFVPKNLRLITEQELMKKDPSSFLEIPVYYEDGSKTTIREVISKIMDKKLKPLMFVDEEGVCKVMVVKKMGEESLIRTEIIYDKIPENFKNMGHSFGNPKSNTIVINLQGGPETDLFTKEIMFRFTKATSVNIEKIFVINIHQFQTLHPDKFVGEEISFKQAKKYNDKTVKILVDLVKYFKSQNKKVILVGTSYGALIIQDFLSQYGNIADKYLISVGRLDTPKKMWKTLSKGRCAKYKNDVDGSQHIATSDYLEIVNENWEVNHFGANMGKLIAGFEYKRYTKLLKNVNLSNVVYIYGTKDEAAGRLTQKEIDFLKSKKAHVISSKDGHNETLINSLEKGFEMIFDKSDF
jgi:hypothetical protein